MNIKIMMKKFIFLFSIFLFFAFSNSAKAKEFSSFYKTTYRFTTSGEALVTQEISLVNETGDYYVSEYKLSIIGGRISNIEAFDKIGPLKINSEIKDENTIITLKFNEKVAGKGKVLSFILKYKSEDLAKKEGNLWQITLPKITRETEIDEYQLFVQIPLDLGKISFVNPVPREETIEDRFYVLNFEKEDLVNFGVLITVGQYQTFHFLLTYDLDNPTNVAKIEKIAIPPDTSFQTVYYQKLEPKPLDVEQDKDGNWLAHYKLEPQQKLTVIAEGLVNLFFQAKEVNQKKTLIKDEEYLISKKNWPADHPKIKEIAQGLKTPEAIYRYVVKTLKYDYQSIKKGAVRKGALGALEDPQHSLCSEFTDLFIALCRAAGIPARELAGFAFSDNPVTAELAKEEDLLHSWPEYFDKEKGRWIMVDPTWEQTSGGLDYFHQFDMSHFVFVIHGLDDYFPLSPGSYKDENSGKQIFVNLSDQEFISWSKSFFVEQVKPQTIFALKKNLMEIEIRNESGYSLNDLTIKLENFSDNDTPKSWLITQVLPFSVFKITFPFKPPEVLKDYSFTLKLILDGEIIELPLKINSFLVRFVPLVGGIVAVILIFLIKEHRKKQTLSRTENYDKILSER